MTAPSPGQLDVEAAVRRYLARLAARYVPVLVGVTALVLVVALVPSTSTVPGQQSVLGTVDDGSGQAVTGATAPAGSGPAAGRPTTAAAGGSAAQPAGGAGVAGPTAGPRAVVPGSGSTSGVSRAGVRCTAGARQVPWSVYAPPCQAAWTGDNGGATSFGVTGSTITLSYRLGNSASDAAITAATGSAAPPRDADYVKDLQVYIDYFNKQFELYGRKVVLRTYQGKGDYIQEDQGQGADRAQADAATARGLKAFGDATFQLRGSNPYWSALAQQRIVAWGPLGFPDSYYSSHAPYWWSVTPSGSDVGSWMGDMSCRRLAGMKAVFSPDKALAAKDRAFGLVHPDNPEYAAIADIIKGKLTACGVKLAREATYSINVAQFQSQATNVIAQMQAAGVTTLLCYCDPVVPIFLGNAAQSQNYRPEWVQPYWGDGQARQPYGGNWQGLMAPGGTWPSRSADEAYQVFKLAGGSTPAETYYAAAYGTLMQLFTSLQAAGPTLTPANLQRGTMALPDSVGFAGRWTYRTGAHAFTPVDQAPVGWFDPTMTSGFDGQKGGYRSCEGGRFFGYGDPASWGGPRVQLRCFGR